MSLDLDVLLRGLGAPEGSVHLLSDDSPESVRRYVDLLPGTKRRAARTVHLPQAVVEYEGRPLVYVFHADALASAPVDDGAFQDALRALACRGDGAFAAVIFPGEVSVYPAALVAGTAQAHVVKLDSADAPMLVHNLARGETGGALRQRMADARSLHKLLLDLLSGVAEKLRSCTSLDSTRGRDQVLPLLGRALFTRFLVDRGIINAQTFPELYKDTTPEHCFETPERAALTCHWLDAKFNGDLLPLLPNVDKPTRDQYLELFTKLARARARPLHELTNVMYRAPDGRLSLDLSWGGLDFAHVPIGLLSEVYEDYAHQFFKEDADRESVWYTPRHIAEFTVEHAFMGLAKERRADARVLDPAAGAGVFLVLAFQRLVAEQFEATGKRPDTREIRRILREQVRGFDINTSALTLAALSLYLAALEMDPDPFPPEKLKFDRLRGSVLRDARLAHEEWPFQGLVLGSLGPRGTLKDDERADILVGNPPWTEYGKWRDDAGNDFNAHVERMVKRVLKAERAQDASLQDLAKTYKHNDNLPDTAFLWRALEWAKPGAVIALVMGGRLLFKRGKGGGDVRDALFRALKVTGVLNGALVKDIWPRLSQAFCIVFAKNEAAQAGGRFTLVTPMLESGPTGGMVMRIDSESREPVDVAVMMSEDNLLKTLTGGTRLDVELIRNIQQLLKQPRRVDAEANQGEQKALSVNEYWNSFKTTKRIGQGFKPGANPAEKVGGRIKELLAKKALTLSVHDLHDKDAAQIIGLRVEESALSPFKAIPIHRLATPAICDPPLVLVRERFSESASDIRAHLYLGSRPLVFARNFYGLSCADHPQAEFLAKYLFCILNSDLFAYYTLHTSAKFGVERRTLLFEDIKDFPIFRVEDMSDAQRESFTAAADGLELDKPKSWVAMNRCVNNLYGLSNADAQVMVDSLATAMPYAAAEKYARKKGQAGVEHEQFRATLEAILRPFFHAEDLEQLSVTKVPLAPEWAWVAFDVRSRNGQSSAATDVVSAIALGLAEQEGASRVFQAVEQGHLRVAIYNECRFLTRSRARLCALDILSDHGKLFPLPER